MFGRKSKVVKLKREGRGSDFNAPANIITRLITNIVALLVVSYLLPGFVLSSLQSAFVAAIVIGVINTYIRPIFQIIALPLTILTLGVGAFLVNVLMLWIASLIVPGFEIMDFSTAIIASLLLTLIGWFFHSLAKD